MFFSENSIFFLLNLNFQLILGARGFQLKIQTEKEKNRVFGKNIFPENLTKISIFSINLISIFSTGEPLTRVAFRVCAADLRITR